MNDSIMLCLLDENFILSLSLFMDEKRASQFSVKDWLMSDIYHPIAGHLVPKPWL
jgi:hypothetical protein